MTRILIILTMLAACLPLQAATQDEPQAAPDAKPCSLRVKNIHAPHHVKAKAGHVKMEVDLELHDCTIPITLSDARQPSPATLSVEPMFGIETQSSLSFREFGPPPYGRQAQAHVVHVSLDTELSDRVSVGRKNISASLSYKSADPGGNPVEGTYAFEIPLDVRPAGYLDRHPNLVNTLVITGETIGGIVLFPVWLVMGIFGLLPSC